MNPITKAIEEVRFSIPPEILEQTFITQLQRQGINLVSLDTMIREQVLEARVFTDIDLHGATEAFLSLEPPVRVEQADPYTVIYQIPEEVTQNRPIVQVYTIHFALLGYHNAGMSLVHSEGAMTSAMRQVLDSATRVAPAATSYLNLIGHNTVMARFVYRPFHPAFIRVRLGNDNALSQIRAQAIPAFSQLCVLATKAFIYNKMLVPMDQGQLSGGQMLGVFREKIMEYADADLMYREALRGWRKQSVFNDPEARRHHVRTIVGLP